MAFINKDGTVELQTWKVPDDETLEACVDTLYNLQEYLENTEGIDTCPLFCEMITLVQSYTKRCSGDD